MEHSIRASDAITCAPGTDKLVLAWQPMVVQMRSSPSPSQVLYFYINSFTTLRSHYALARITGTLVEVKYIAVDIIGTSFVTNTNVNYSIDGVPRGTAVRNPENRTSYVYDRSLLSATGLENVEHTLSVYLSPPSVLLVWYCFCSSKKMLTRFLSAWLPRVWGRKNEYYERSERSERSGRSRQYEQ